MHFHCSVIGVQGKGNALHCSVIEIQGKGNAVYCDVIEVQGKGNKVQLTGKNANWRCHLLHWKL